MKTIRLVIADDHTLVRTGLRMLLQTFHGVQVVGEATSGLEAIEIAAELRPDIILMDISMPKLNGIEATSRVKKKIPGTRVIVLSMHINENYVLQAVAAGASGYLLKQANAAELETAIRTIANGETYFAPAASACIVERLRGGNERNLYKSVLTPRQQEILQLISDGYTGKKIASKLKISARTVEGHRAEIMERLNVHDLAGLVRYAIQNGLVQSDQ